MTKNTVYSSGIFYAFLITNASAANSQMWVSSWHLDFDILFRVILVATMGISALLSAVSLKLMPIKSKESTAW